MFWSSLGTYYTKKVVFSTKNRLFLGFDCKPLKTENIKEVMNKIHRFNQNILLSFKPFVMLIFCENYDYFRSILELKKSEIVMKNGHDTIRFTSTPFFLQKIVFFSSQLIGNLCHLMVTWQQLYSTWWQLNATFWQPNAT